MSPVSEPLPVVLYGRTVGHLVPVEPTRQAIRRRSTEAAEFHYDSDYLGSSAVRAPLSVRMPLDPGPVPARKVEAFLAGLLPENLDSRRELARQLDVPDQPVSLLARIGWDCPGAVQITTVDRLADMQARAGGLERIDDVQIAARLEAVTRDQAAWSEPNEHWSLAGQQAKIALAQLPDGAWAEATGSAPTTHIIKPGIGHLMHQALVEHATMVAAGALGVDVAESHYTEFEARPAIIVTRFDRRRTSRGVVRIHQEDMCQAVGRLPEAKYEADGGPGLADMAAVLRTQVRTDPTKELTALADFALINYAAAAPDGHAKNVSIRILPTGQVAMAPLYDLSTALPYDRTFDTLALSMGGERSANNIHARQWTRLAADLSVDEDHLRRRARTLVSNFPDAFHDALAEVGTPAARAIWGRTADRAEKHRTACLQRLDEPSVRARHRAQQR